VSAFTRQDLQALPAVLDVPTGARVLGVGLTTARDLVRTGRWPSPVLRVGRQYRIPTAPLLAALGITTENVDDTTSSTPLRAV